MLASFALTLPWRWLDPPTTAFILQDRLQNKNTMHQRWIPLSEISPALPIAIVAAEDQKFPHHHGFDLQSISKALNEDRYAFFLADMEGHGVAAALYTMHLGMLWHRHYGLLENPAEFAATINKALVPIEQSFLS